MMRHSESTFLCHPVQILFQNAFSMPMPLKQKRIYTYFAGEVYIKYPNNISPNAIEVYILFRNKYLVLLSAFPKRLISIVQEIISRLQHVKFLNLPIDMPLPRYYRPLVC